MGGKKRTADTGICGKGVGDSGREMEGKGERGREGRKEEEGEKRRERESGREGEGGGNAPADK